MKYLSSIILSLVLLGIWGCSDLGVGVSCSEGLDCAGECGGSAVVDVCGDCGGSGLNATGCCGNSTDCIHYLDDIKSIFTDNCISCHGGSHGTGLDLRTYASLMVGSNNGDVIVASDNSNSLLLQKVSSGAMPPSGNLTAAQITLISTWIDEGAIEN